MNQTTLKFFPEDPENLTFKIRSWDPLRRIDINNVIIDNILTGCLKEIPQNYVWAFRYSGSLGLHFVRDIKFKGQGDSGNTANKTF